MSEKNDSYKSWLPLLLGLAGYIGLFAGMKMRQAESPKTKFDSSSQFPDNPSQKITDVLSYIHSKYIDSIELNMIAENAIDQMLNSLDPYSDYLTKEESQYFARQLEGRLAGLGVEIISVDNRYVIYDVVARSSADKSGLQIGDQLISIDNIFLKDLEEKKIALLLKNAKDSTILLKWIQKNSSQIIERVLPVEPYKVSSVEAVHSPQKGIAFIKLNNFGNNSFREFMEGLEHLVVKEDCKHLILDLRDNPGGLVHVAADILNQLVREKDLLLFKTAGHRVNSSNYKSIGRPFFQIDKIAVLINENTSSSAEIVAASLQDLDRAIIIGTPSFGKGSIVEQFSLGDGSAIRLATSRFYTSSGRSIQKYDSVLYPIRNKRLDSVYYSKEGKKLPQNLGVVPDIVLDTLSLADLSFQRSSISYAKQWLFKNINELEKIKTSSQDDDRLPLQLSILLKKSVLADQISFTKRNTYDQIEKEVLFEYHRYVKGYDYALKSFLLTDPAFKLAIHYMK